MQILLSPPVNAFPPRRLHPLVERGLGPFSICPPLFAELVSITRRCNAEVILRQPMLKDQQRAPRVEFRRHDEYPVRA